MIATIKSWLSALIAWVGRIFEWLKGLFGDFMEFLIDLPVKIFGGILDGIIYILSLIPVPDFLQQGLLQTLFNSLGSDVLYFVDFFGVDKGLGVIGAAIVFNLTRKALTLGQW